jgi:predicted  nucleic acid-binding Zn-ribbon protein
MIKPIYEERGKRIYYVTGPYENILGEGYQYIKIKLFIANEKLKKALNYNYADIPLFFYNENNELLAEGYTDYLGTFTIQLPFDKKIFIKIGEKEPLITETELIELEKDKLVYYITYKGGYGPDLFILDQGLLNIDYLGSSVSTLFFLNKSKLNSTDLLGSIADKDVIKQSVKKEYSSLKNKISKLNESVVLFKSTLSFVPNQILTAEEMNQLVSDINFVESNLGTVNEEITQRLESIDSTINTINSNIETIDTNIVDIKSDLSKIFTTLVELRTDIDLIDSGVKELTSNLSTLSQNLNDVVKRVDKTETDITTLTTNVNKLTNDLSNLDTRVDATETNIIQINEDLDTIEQNYTALKQKVDNLKLTSSLGELTNVDESADETLEVDALLVKQKGSDKWIPDNTLISTVNTLMEKVFPFTMTLTGGGTYEKGSSNSVVLRWTYDRDITYQEINKEELDISLRTKTYNNVTENTIYRLIAIYNSKEYEKSVSATFNIKKYYGVSEKTSLTNDEIKALTSTWASKALATTKFDCTGGKYPYYIIPTSLANNITFYINGFANSNWSTEVKNVINNYGYSESYTIYRLNTIQTGILNIEVR